MHERTVHAQKVNQARLNPAETLAASIDGSSQLQFGIPSFKEISKLECGKMRIQNHLEIVEVAGTPDNIYVYTVPEDIPGNPNVTVEVIQRFLKVCDFGFFGGGGVCWYDDVNVDHVIHSMYVTLCNNRKRNGAGVVHFHRCSICNWTTLVDRTRTPTSGDT